MPGALRRHRCQVCRIRIRCCYHIRSRYCYRSRSHCYYRIRSRRYYRSHSRYCRIHILYYNGYIYNNIHIQI